MTKTIIPQFIDTPFPFTLSPLTISMSSVVLTDAARTTNGPQMFTAAASTSITGGTFQTANKIVNLNNPQSFQRGNVCIFHLNRVLKYFALEQG